MSRLQPGQLEFTANGAPFVVQQGEEGSSLALLTANSQQIFLAHNGLPAGWRGKDRYVILETGFGFGLNFLNTWRAWRDDPARCRRLHFLAFSAHPLSALDLGRSLALWPELAALAGQLCQHWPLPTPGMHRLHLDEGQVILTLVFGDPASQLRAINASVNAFILNGFSPEQGSSLVTPHLAKALARLTAPGATLVSLATEDAVKEALEAAEFSVEIQPGISSDTNILTGQFRSRRPNRHQAPTDRRAIVIGAGIAGSTTAHRLAAAGWQVTVLEAEAQAASGASGNIAGVLRPLPSADDNRLSRLTRAGFLATRALLNTLPEARWSACGVLHLARETEHEAQQKRTVEALALPPEILQYLDRAVVSDRINWPVDNGGWWFPSGGWVQPPSLCRAALSAFPERITVHCNATVHQLKMAKTGWQAMATDGTVLAEAPVMIMASGVAATRFEQFSWLPQTSARGQVSHLPAGSTPPLDTVVWKIGYATPLVDGQRLIGASLSYEDTDSAEHLADHRDNLARINLALRGFTKGIDPTILRGHVGFRPMSPDRLPIVGAVPCLDGSAPATTHRAMIPTYPGLWCVQGFGARGIVWSALMADLLLSKIEGEPLPLESDLVDALDPARFTIRPKRPS